MTCPDEIWKTVFGYIELKDVFKVQSINVYFWCLVNPSSPKC
jgi:hypothetical protein